MAPNIMKIHVLHLYLIGLICVSLTVVARLGLVVDALLVLMAAAMLLNIVGTAQLPKRIRAVILSFLLLFGFYVIGFLDQPSFVGLVNAIGIGISLLFFVFFAIHGRTLIAFPGTAGILVAGAVLVVVVGAALDLVSKNTISGIAAYFLLTAGLVWVANGKTLFSVTLLIAVLFVFLAFGLGHRLMLGAAVLLMGTVGAVRLVPSESIRTLGLITFVGILFFIIALFAGIGGLSIISYDALIIEYTGRTARSGRDFIWPLIIGATSDSPWIGLGTGTTVSNLFNTDLSAHNYFLQIYMQAGLVGVGLLLLILFSIWRAIGRPQKTKPVTIFATGAFLFVLLHASFEVFLMQVNLLMGCCAWMLLGFGVAQIRQTRAPDISRPTPIPAVTQPLIPREPT